MNFLGKIKSKSQVADRDRYEKVYSKLHESNSRLETGISAVPEIFRSPFVKYYDLLKSNIHSNTKVLELGSGTGIHTKVLCELANDVTALDISKSSLDLCKKNTSNKVKVILGSMESIPCPDNSFDVVVSCGSFSYAKLEKLKSEIERVLVPGGTLIYLDSLNYNPIYVLNRFVHFLFRNRTLLTVLRIPTMGKLRAISENFSSSEIFFFDSFLWLRNLLVKIGIRIPKFLMKLETSRKLQFLAFRIVGIKSMFN